MKKHHYRRVVPLFRTIAITILGIVIVFIILGLTKCPSKEVDTDQGENRTAAKTIEEVLNENTSELMSIPGVVGTGQGLCDGKPCIQVYVIKKTPELNKKIPRIIEGFPVSIEETGEIKPLPRKK